MEAFPSCLVCPERAATAKHGLQLLVQEGDGKPQVTRADAVAAIVQSAVARHLEDLAQRRNHRGAQLLPLRHPEARMCSSI